MEVIKYLYRAALAATILANAAFSSAAELCREISLGYTSGDIDGHLQAPFADYPDAAALRPSFSDLGYDGFHQLNFEGGYVYGQNRFYLHYDRTRLDDKQTNLDLPALNSEFVAPVPLTVSSQLDLYRLGYQRLFETQLFGRQLILAPGAELAALDFDYRQQLDLSQAPVAQPVEVLNPDAVGGIYTGNIPGGIFDEVFGYSDFVVAIHVPTEIDRSYTETSLRVGGEAEYQLSDRFSLTAELYDSIPLDDRPEILTAMIGLRFEVFASENAAVYLQARAGRETLEYEDGGGSADDVRAEYRDLLQGEISLRF